MQGKLLLPFVKEVNGVRLAIDAIRNKLAVVENYNTTLTNTHIVLYQVLGLHNNNRFTKATMWICWGL